ncbi:hypothetical protein PIB30_083362 [Stylosanthes scabra]|uniref:Putative plant transposon protein domain-containing protein n=1 Tax=Stylosanthes scabra TaxID=79078 RepID=A0ABU6YR22_9FABA|nr:hypothetical protein [Stylosanthes scabra]
MASSSSTGASVLDAHCYRTLFNQQLYEETAHKKKVIPEVGFNLNDEYPEIMEHIARRGWRSIASPRQEIAKSMIQELYANAAWSEEEMEGHDEHPYKSYVRGKEIDFPSANIRRVMRFREATPGAENNYDNRQSHDQQIDQVLKDLCILGATWKMGDDIKVENLIADGIILIAQGLSGKGKLGFPSTIYKLCKDAKVRMRKFRNFDLIPEGKYITAEVMKTVRVPRVVQQHQPRNEDEDHEMPQYVPENETDFGNLQHEQQHHQFQQQPQQQYHHQQPPYEDYHQYQQTMMEQ